MNFTKIKRRVVLATAGAGGAVVAGSVAFADSKAKSTISNVLGIIVALFQYVGFVLMAWGIGQFVISLKNDDADSKVKAIWLIVAAAALIGFRVLFEAIVSTNEMPINDVGI